MRSISFALYQQSRMAEAAAWQLRDLSEGTPAPYDLLAVAGALEQTVATLRCLARDVAGAREAML